MRRRAPFVLAGILFLLGVSVAQDAVRTKAQGPPAVAPDLALSRVASTNTRPQHSPAETTQARANYQRLPLSFEPNQGQTGSDVQYLARGGHFNVFLTHDEVVFSFARRSTRRRQLFDNADGDSEPPALSSIELRLEGASPTAAVSAVEALPGKANYLVGRDPKQWHLNLPTFAKVRYRNVYPGVDLLYYGNQGELESDFIIAPGANPETVKLSVAGAEMVTVDASGDVVLRMKDGALRLRKPLVYQGSGSSRKQIAGSYVLAGQNQVGFRVAQYDRHLPLVIDPVLSYSTYLGGNGVDEATAIAVDSAGNAYITGDTTSTNFPVTGAPATGDMFVAKLDPNGAKLYATYIGGTALADFPLGIGVDALANAYVVGQTSENNLPTTTGALRATYQGGSTDGFVFSLNSTGSGFNYFTYLGGSASDRLTAVAVDSLGNAYITGQTTSGDYPTASPFETLAAAGDGGMFTTTNSGTNWSASATGLVNRNITAVAVDPKTPTTIYAATSESGVIKSTNSAAAWSPINSGLTTLAVTALVVDPVTPANVYVGTASGGVFVSNNGGASWAAMNNGLAGNNVQALAIDPVSPGTLYASTGQNVFFKFSVANGSWSPTGTLPQDIATAIVVDPTNNQNVYASFQNSGVYRSSNGGTSWTAFTSGLSSLPVVALAIDHGGHLYASTRIGGGVFLSTSGGSWTAINTGLPLSGFPALATDPTNNTTVYASTLNGGVFRSTNNGASWSEPASNGLNTTRVTALAVDPITPTNLYAGSQTLEAVVTKLNSSGGLVFSSYLGGGGVETGLGIAIDGDNGNLYVAGRTDSLNFPTVTPAQATMNGGFSGFISKVKSDGSGLAYSTYLGGSGNQDQAYAIAADSAGNAYVTGYTSSADFPTLNPTKSTLSGASDAFVAKYSASGQKLFATYLGGEGTEAGNAITATANTDGSTSAWVAGQTTSNFFPLANPIQLEHGDESGGSNAGFVSDFSFPASGAVPTLVFSTYLGSGCGSSGCDTVAQAIGHDGTNNIYVAGRTMSNGFPTVNAVQSALAGTQNAFIAKIGSTTNNADLSLTLNSFGPTTVVAGAAVNFSLTVTNNGPNPATNVSLGGRGGANLSIITCTVTQGVCGDNLHVLDKGFAELGTLASGASATVTGVLRPLSPCGVAGVPACPFVIVVDARSDANDPNPANNSVSTNLTVLAGADLGVTLSESPAAVQVGGTLTYTATATNLGPNTASNVTAVLTVSPAGAASFVSPPTGCTPSSNTLTCAIGPMNSGTSSVGQLAVTVNSLPITATITVSNTPEGDPDLANNTATVSTNSQERLLLADYNTSSVLVLDPSNNNSLLETVGAGTNAVGVAVSPNRRLAFVGNLNATYSSVIDLTIGREIRRIQGVRAAWNLALTADGSLLVVPDLDKGDLVVIDTNSLQILARVGLADALGDSGGTVAVGSVVVVGTRAFVGNYGDLNTGQPLPLAVVDLTSLQANQVNGTSGSGGSLSSALAATPDGSTVVAINQFSDTLWIINPATNSVTQTVNLPWDPDGIAITPNGSDPTKIFGYIVHSGGAVASVLDLRSGSATFGQILAGTDVTLPSASWNADSYVPMSVSRDGTRLAIAATGSTSGTNVAILDSGLMRTNPATAVVSSFHAGASPSSLRGLAYALADNNQPPTTAPTVTAFSSDAINNADTPITITGTNFAPGALVRIGKMDPIAATNVTSTSLSVAVPQNAPAQLGADIIVTNPVPASGPASLSNEHQSGVLAGQFTIFASPNFHPLNQVLNSNFGDNTESLLDLRNKVNTSVPVGLVQPEGAAITPDGLYGYVASFRALPVQAINLSAGSVAASIALPTGAYQVGQNHAVAIAPNPATGTAAAYVLFGWRSTTQPFTYDLQVAMIDANPASPTFNTVIRTLSTGLNSSTRLTPGGIAVTPDGKFVYANDATSAGRIVVFDVVGNTAAALSATTLGVTFFQPEPYVTPDGNSLLLVDANGPLDVFDISASRTNPTLVTKISGSAPPGGVAPFFGAYRVTGTQLFAYDSSQQVVQAFNFDRAHSNFTQLGSYVIPGNSNEFSADLGITPDGSLLYAQLGTDDAVAALDAQALASGSANPLITKIATGLAPFALAISPIAVGEPDLSVGITANPSTGVFVGGSITYTVTVNNARNAAATGVTLAAALSPAVTVNSVSPPGCTTTTVSSSTVVTCALGTVTQGTPVTVTITAVAPAAGISCGSSTLGCIIAGAAVTENEIDFNPADNSAPPVITPVLAQGATSCTGTTTNWLGGTGNWSDATKWSTGVVPNSSSVNVCIDNGNPAASQVTLDINAAVGNLTIDANDSLIISNNTALIVSGNISNSGHISVNAAGNTTFLQIAGGQNVSLSGGGTLTMSTSGNGTPVINQTSGGATLTNVDNTIQGQGQVGNNGLALVNQASGTINANVAAPLLLNSNGITNAGTLAATSGGTLQTNTTVNNTGGTISSTGSNSAVQFLNGTTVQGGTLNAGAGALLGTAASNTATLDGITHGALTNAGTYTGANNSITILRGAITNSGAILVSAAGNNTQLQVAGGQNTSLAGGGTVTLSTSGNGTAVINQTSGGATLTNVDNTIQGKGEIGNNGLALVNQAGGTINANAAGTLTVDASAVTNQHLMEATSGGTLAVNNTTVNNNASTILANGGTVQFTATTIQGGTLNTLNSGVLGTASGQTVTLDGLSTHQGTLNNTGTYTAPNNSATILLGTINNTGAILLAAAGNTTLLQIAGGQTTTLTGAGTVTMSTSGNGTPFINQTSGGGILNNADNTIQGQGDIGNNGLALINSGTINATVSGKTLTIDAVTPTNAGTFEATGGGILSLANSVINNKSGIISADAAGSAVQFVNGVTLQSGTLSATNGGLLGTAASATATLDGSTLGQQITLSGTYTAANNSSTVLMGTINNTGSLLLSATGNTTLLQVRGGQSVTLTGGGTVTMSTSGNGTPIINQTSGGSTLTNVNNLIQGQGEIGNNGLKLVNQAIINANVPGHTLTIDALTPTNSGTLQATGGGVLALNNSVVNNQAGTITVDGAASAVQFVNGATIQGGTLATINGGLLGTAASTTITLDGSTHGALTNAGVFVGANNSSTILVGTINNTGAIQISAAGNTTLLQVTGGQNVTLTGGGTVTLSTGGNGTAIINQTSGGSTLTNVNNLIQGQGQIGNNGLALINQAGGTINANVGGPLIINGSTVTNQHLIEATGGGTLQVNTTVIGSGGTIAASGAGSAVQFLNGTSLQGGTLSTSGGAVLGTVASNNVTLDGSTGNGPVINAGTYTGANNSTTVVRGAINNTGAILVSAAGNTTLLQVAGGQNTTLAGTGVVTMSTSGNGTPIINQSSGGSTLTNAGNTIQGQGVIGNNGLSVVNQGTITANLSGVGTYSQTAGSTVIATATTASVTSFAISGGTARLDGTLNAPSGVSITGSGTLSGTGSINGAVSMAGVIQPGDAPAPGILTVASGGYTQSAAGALNILLGGSTPGTFSQLNLAGSATLGGTLNASVVNGFNPPPGSSFTILTSPSVSGTFATVNLPALWQVVYNPTSVAITVGAPVSADVAVALTASPSPVPVLGSVTYQITVANNGPNPASGVALTDALPANTVFASIDDLTDCAVSSGTLKCNFGALAVGSTNVKTVNLILVPLAVPAGAGTFDNTATVTASESDPTPSNNTATQTVQVTGTNLPGGGAFRGLPGLFANVLPGNDDNSVGPVAMNLNLNFFGLQASTVFVNNNGNVTFNSALGTFTPFPLTSTSVPIIAPYFADVETDFPTSGQVTYGNDTVNGRPVFGVNWPGVEYCCGSDPTKHNVFQLLLVDRSDVGTGDFDIEFNYDQIQWETGDASGGTGGLGGSSARVGYSNGSQTAGSFFELPGSGVPGSFLDANTTSGLIYNSLNSTQPGRYVFQVRGGAVQSSADLAMSANGPQSATAGSIITYTLTATNLGPNAATGVTVTNTLPTGFTFVSAAPGGICAPAGQPVVVTCNVGSLANGANAVITIQAAIPVSASGQATDTAVVSVPNNQDLNLGNNTATVVTNVAILPAVLSIAKTHSGNFAQGQSGATYTITVSNAAGAGVTHGTVTVADTIPSGLTATAISGTGWTCPSLTRCNRTDSLAAGASYPPITLTVDVAFSAPASVTNTAMVSGGGAVNPATANDLTTIIPAAADLVPVIAIVPPPDASGTTISYAITVTNKGPSSATQVQLTNQLVGNAAFVSASSPNMTCPAPGANSLACTVAVLNNGANALVNITVNLTGAGWDSNTVHVTSQVPDLIPGNNVAVVQKVSAGGNTVTGSEVAVQPLDATTGASPAILTFASVTRGGTTTVSSATSGPAPPAGFRTGTPAVFYNLSTTAGYSGAISVALGFNGVSFHHPANVRLFHSENGAWVDRTVAINSAGGYAIAQVTSLSPFAMFEPINHVPDAKLGSNLTAAATSAQEAKVTLNGSASIDADHDPLTYRWTGPFPEGNGVVTGVSPTVTMPAGANTVTLVVNDGEADSKPAEQIIIVTDFNVTAAAAGPTTISAGASVKFNVTASPQFGPFPAAVSLACLGLPQGAQCSFSSATVNAGGPAATVTITTTARTAALLAPVPHGNRTPFYALWMPLPAIAMMGLGARRCSRKRTAALMLLLMIGMMTLVVSCGGGSMGVTPQPQQFGTPAGTYTITVMGTANGTLQHTTPVTFTVQ